MIATISLLALSLTRLKILCRPIASGLILSTVLLAIFFDYQYRGVIFYDGTNTQLCLFPILVTAIGAFSIWLNKPLYKLVLPFLIGSIFLNFGTVFNPYVFSFFAWLVLISPEKQFNKAQTFLSTLFPIVNYVIYLIFENGLMNISTLENVAYFNSDVFYVPLVKLLTFVSMVLIIYFIAKQIENFLILSKPEALAKIVVLISLFIFFRENSSSELSILALVFTILISSIVNNSKGKKEIAMLSFVVLATFGHTFALLFPVLLLLFNPIIWSTLPKAKQLMLSYFPILTVLVAIASLIIMTLKNLSVGEMVICFISIIHLIRDGRNVRASLKEVAV